MGWSQWSFSCIRTKLHTIREHKHFMTERPRVALTFGGLFPVDGYDLDFKTLGVILMSVVST